MSSKAWVLGAFVLVGCAQTPPAPAIPEMHWVRGGVEDSATPRDLYECQREAFAVATDESGRMWLHMSCMRARGYAFVPKT